MEKIMISHLILGTQHYQTNTNYILVILGIPVWCTIIPGWWLSHPSEKYESVNWDDDIPNISGKIRLMATKPPTKYMLNLWFIPYVRGGEPPFIHHSMAFQYNSLRFSYENRQGLAPRWFPDSWGNDCSSVPSCCFYRMILKPHTTISIIPNLYYCMYIYIWYMIYDIWYMIYDIWYMIYDIWYIYIYGGAPNKITELVNTTPISLCCMIPMTPYNS